MNPNNLFKKNRNTNLRLVNCRKRKNFVARNCHWENLTFGMCGEDVHEVHLKFGIDGRKFKE